MATIQMNRGGMAVKTKKHSSGNEICSAWIGEGFREERVTFGLNKVVPVFELSRSSSEIG